MDNLHNLPQVHNTSCVYSFDQYLTTEERFKNDSQKNDACIVPTNTEETVSRDSVQYKDINNTGINQNLKKQTPAY